jgi:hypothetical protein
MGPIVQPTRGDLEAEHHPTARPPGDTASFDPLAGIAGPAGEAGESNRDLSAPSQKRRYRPRDATP